MRDAGRRPLVAANPPAADELDHLHSTIELLVGHHRGFGYRHFVVNHGWRSGAAVADLRRRLTRLDADVRVFLLTLGSDENLRRIERRQHARALDEREFELRTVAEEREAMTNPAAGDLGEPFDVSAPPSELVIAILQKLSLR